MEMGRSITVRARGIPNFANRIALLYTLSHLKRRALQKVSVKRSIPVRMRDNDVVRRRTIWPIDCDDDTVSDGSHDRATSGSKIHTEMQALTSPVEDGPIAVGGHRVAVPLTHKPG
jgi:hypothetical protein